MSVPTFTKPADATHEVVEMECAALVRWGTGDPGGFLLVVNLPASLIAPAVGSFTCLPPPPAALDRCSPSPDRALLVRLSALPVR